MARRFDRLVVATIAVGLIGLVPAAWQLLRTSLVDWDFNLIRLTPAART